MSAFVDARWYVPMPPAPDERLMVYQNRLRQLGAAQEAEYKLRVMAGENYRAALSNKAPRLYAMEAAATAQDVEPEYVDGH